MASNHSVYQKVYCMQSIAKEKKTNLSTTINGNFIFILFYFFPSHLTFDMAIHLSAIYMYVCIRLRYSAIVSSIFVFLYYN